MELQASLLLENEILADTPASGNVFTGARNDDGELLKTMDAEPRRVAGVAQPRGLCFDPELLNAADYDGPTLIERVIDLDDCSSDLISRGRMVAAANARPPRSQ